MKYVAVISTALLASLAAAAPTPTSDNEVGTGILAKRASITDTPTTGYATTNGGTTGGRGGSTTTVSTYAQFTAAASDDSARIIVVSGTITQAADQVRVGANKTIVGKSGAKLVGFGLLIKKANVIVRNLSISKVLAANGDAIVSLLALTDYGEKLLIVIRVSKPPQPRTFGLTMLTSALTRTMIRTIMMGF